MNESTATRYQRARRRADALAFVSSALALGVIAVSPASPWLARAAEGFGRGLTPGLQHAVALLLFVSVVVIVCEIAALPARVRHAPGPRRPVEEILSAQAQAALVFLPAAILAGGAVHLAARLAGPAWWMVGAVLVATGMITALYGGPSLVARLARARALDRPKLAERLIALARRAGVPIAGIDEIRAADAGLTAMVTGFGRSRRVFLSADVARDWTDDEVAVVVAHEIAHHANHDLLRTLALDAVVVAVALGAAGGVLVLAAPSLSLSGAADLAALPLIAVVAGAVWSVATPLRHAVSRRQERLADARALIMTGGADAFGAAVRRLGERRLAEERPSLLTRWLYARHPSVTERLTMAEAYRRSGPRPRA